MKIDLNQAARALPDGDRTNLSPTSGDADYPSGSGEARAIFHSPTSKFRSSGSKAGAHAAGSATMCSNTA